MRTLSLREQRLVALALLTGVAAGLWAAMISPLLNGYFEHAAAREALMQEFVRNDRILARLPGWRAEAEAQARTFSSYAIAAPSNAIAAEILAQRIARAAKAAGGQVQTSQPVGQKTPAGWVHVQGDLNLTIGQLYTVLTRLQSEEPYVVAGYLSIEAQSDPDPGEPEKLAVRMDVFAPVRTGRASSPAGTVSRRS